MASHLLLVNKTTNYDCFQNGTHVSYWKNIATCKHKSSCVNLFSMAIRHSFDIWFVVAVIVVVFFYYSINKYTASKALSELWAMNTHIHTHSHPSHGAIVIEFCVQYINSWYMWMRAKKVAKAQYIWALCVMLIL